MKMNKKLTALIIIIVLAAIMYFISGIIPANKIACTADALICPDGSSVGRQGPKCEFAPCPTRSTNKNADTPKFRCPETEWVDCMPGPRGIKSECNSQYLNWAQANCPNFKGGAY